MASHVIDMIMLKNNFGTEEMRKVWSDRNRLQKHLDVEAALAEAEGELEIIPKNAADTISSHSDVDMYNIEEIAQEVLRLKHSLTPTINAIQKLCGKHGEYVHYGVTTQDVVDTGAMLQLKEANQIIVRELKDVCRELIRLSKDYKDTPITGRTHGMQALPTTFGFKMTVVLSELVRHLERLKQAEPRVFTGVIAGAVGTYASFGDKGMEVEKLTLKKLGLNVPQICWHSSRDRVSEYADIIELISGTLGKLGNEFYNLMRTEINEIEEPFSKNKIGSSTMPQKRNPAAFEGLSSLTRPIFHSTSLIHESLIVEHERDAVSWRAEWIALPEICIYISSQLATTKAVLKGLVVKPENMLKNLNMQGGLIMSERILFALGKELGKQTAHHLVYELAMDSFENKKPFKEVLMGSKQVMSILSEKEIDELLDPKTYLGLAVQKVDNVLDEVQRSGLL